MTRQLHDWELPLTEPLARQFHDLADLGTTFSPIRYAEFIRSSNDSGTLGAFGYFVDGELAGMLIGVLGNQFFTDAVIAQEVMWFVRPEHRKGVQSVRLLTLFEAWAKKCGADGTIMASFGQQGNDDNLRKFYRRRGFREIETHYLKHSSWQSQPQQHSQESEPPVQSLEP